MVRQESGLFMKEGTKGRAAGRSQAGYIRRWGIKTRYLTREIGEGHSLTSQPGGWKPGVTAYLPTLRGMSGMDRDRA
jgi:hypothetical protein